MVSLQLKLFSRGNMLTTATTPRTAQEKDEKGGERRRKIVYFGCSC